MYCLLCLFMTIKIIINNYNIVGFRCFEWFTKLGITVNVISSELVTSQDWLQRVKNQGKYIVGDCRSEATLQEAGVTKASFILCLTEYIVVNILTAKMVRKITTTGKNNERRIIIICRTLDADHRNLEIIHDTMKTYIDYMVCATQLGQRYFLAFLLEAVNDNGTENFVMAVDDVYSARGFRYGFKTEKTTLLTTPETPLDYTTFFKRQASGSGGNTWVEIKLMKKTGNHYKYFLSRFVFLAKYRNLFEYFFGVFVFITVAAIILKFKMAQPLSWSEAFYFVTSIITTVGFGDINFLDEPYDLKIFGMFLMFTGAGLVAILFSSITEFILSDTLIKQHGGKSKPKKNHVIIAGANTIGIHIIEELVRWNIPVLIIEYAPLTGVYSIEIKRKVTVITGDPTLFETLELAHIRTAAAICVSSNDDSLNLRVCLSAISVGNKRLHVIGRIFDSTLADQLNNDCEKFKNLCRHVNFASVSSLSAPYFVAAAFLGEKLDTNSYTMKDITVIPHRIGDGYSLSVYKANSTDTRSPEFPFVEEKKEIKTELFANEQEKGIFYYVGGEKMEKASCGLHEAGQLE